MPSKKSQIKKSNECDDLNDILNSECTPAQTQIKYTPDTYVLRFGVHKNKLAKDVAEECKIRINKQTGQAFKDRCGLKYLKWLMTEEWLNEADKDIIKQIVKNYKYEKEAV